VGRSPVAQVSRHVSSRGVAGQRQGSMSFSRRVLHMDPCPWPAPRQARRRDGIPAVALSCPAAGRHTSRGCDSGLIFGLIRLRSSTFISIQINAAIQVMNASAIRRTIIQTSENRKDGGSRLLCPEARCHPASSEAAEPTRRSCGIQINGGIRYLLDMRRVDHVVILVRGVKLGISVGGM
jgi:hypothetical protein